MKEETFPPRVMSYPDRISMIGKAFMISTLQSHRKNRKDWERAFYDFIEDFTDPCGIPSQLETTLKRERVNKSIVSTNVYFDSSRKIPSKENIYQLAAVTFEGYSPLGKLVLQAMETSWTQEGPDPKILREILTDNLYSKAKPDIVGK